MGDDILTRGVKDMIAGAATAGGMGQLLQAIERLDGRLAHIEKGITGSIGSWEMTRLADVQFQTYERAQYYPDELIVFSLTGQECFGGVPERIATLNPVGHMRIAHVEFGIEFEDVVPLPMDQFISTLSLVWRISAGVAFDIAFLAVSRQSPYAAINFPMPYPTRSYLGGQFGARDEPLTRRSLELWIAAPAGRPHSLKVMYFDVKL